MAARIVMTLVVPVLQRSHWPQEQDCPGCSFSTVQLPVLQCRETEAAEAAEVAPSVPCDSTVVLCFHDCPVCIQREIISCCRFSPPFPSSQIPTLNSSPHPRIVLQSPCSSSQHPCTPVTHIQSKVHRHGFFVWLSLYSDS